MRYETPLLEDRDFWLRMEFYLSGRLASSGDRNLRPYWIDGVVPESFRRTNRNAVVEGKIWVAKDRDGQQQYRFIAHLGWKTVNRDRSCLDGIGLSIDHDRKVVEIAKEEKGGEPGATDNPGNAR